MVLSKFCRSPENRLFENTKFHLELNLARDVKDNRKVFFKDISSKRKIGENVAPLLNEVGALVTEDTEKAELQNAFFTSLALRNVR